MTDHDGPGRQILEQLSNGVSRHRFLNKAAKGIFAVAATLALGEVEISKVFAATCYNRQDHNPSGCWGVNGCCSSASASHQCPNYPGYCDHNRNYAICTHDMCPGYCDYYGSGWWTCPAGYGGLTSYCQDCVLIDPNSGSPSCSSACTGNYVA